MHRGTCLCESVRYTIKCEPRDCCYCHCSVCRRLTGSAMSACGTVDVLDFTWTRGEDAISTYAQNNSINRLFCSKCGSYLATTHAKAPGQTFIALGCLDATVECEPEFHQFAGSKAKWCKIQTELPQFEGWADWESRLTPNKRL